MGDGRVCFTRYRVHTVGHPLPFGSGSSAVFRAGTCVASIDIEIDPSDNRPTSCATQLQK
jgi:hypothetical protein